MSSVFSKKHVRVRYNKAICNDKLSIIVFYYSVSQINAVIRSYIQVLNFIFVKGAEGYERIKKNRMPNISRRAVCGYGIYALAKADNFRR